MLSRSIGRILGMLLLAYACCCFAQTQAQSADSSDRIKISASYLNTEFKANPLEAIEYLKGFSVDADARIFSKNGFRLGAVVNWQRQYNVEVFSDYLGMEGFDIYRDVNTYAFGVQLSKRFGPVEPFGAFLLGARKLHEDLSYEVVRKYRAGVDVPFHSRSNFFVRPFFVEFETSGGLAQGFNHKYGAGAGFRF